MTPRTSGMLGVGRFHRIIRLFPLMRLTQTSKFTIWRLGSLSGSIGSAFWRRDHSVLLFLGNSRMERVSFSLSCVHHCSSIRCSGNERSYVYRSRWRQSMVCRLQSVTFRFLTSNLASMRPNTRPYINFNAHVEWHQRHEFLKCTC